MRRSLLMPFLAVASLAFTGVAASTPGHVHNSMPAWHKTFTVTTADHGCASRPWATDQLRRTFMVTQNQDGSYTVTRHDTGTFTTTGPLSPSADPCPGVIRKGRHGTTLKPGVKGKMHGFITGTVTGGTFNPNGTCAADCGNVAFIAGFFTAGSQFTCNNGYAGCRFDFEYAVPRHHHFQHQRYHHWSDRGLDGVHEIFIGDIATT